MLELVYISFGLLLIKLFSDLARNRWNRSWLSSIAIVDWWKNLPTPWDLWHILQGALYTFVAYLWLDYNGYGGVVLVLYLAIWWALFFSVFSLCYHYLFMKREWWGS